MRRVGKYTKKNGVRSAKLETNKYLLWFRNLKRWQKIAVFVVPIMTVLILIPLLTYLYFARDIADKDRLMNRNNTGIVLMDNEGKTFYQTGRSSHRDLVPLNGMSDYVKKALLSSEDKNFYNQGAFSFTSILGALYANIVTGGSNYGGSTITQQLAKNTLLTNQKTFLRKYQELSVAIAIDRKYSKDDILAMYLNSVYFGENAFGIGDAAKTYFGTTPDKLTLAQSAMLIGVLPAPSAYSPISGSVKYAKERQTTVLSRMVKNGVITEGQKEEALAEELVYAPQTSPTQDSPAPAFAEMVIAQLNKKYGEEKVARSGFQVKTTLNLGVQNQLQQNINNNMSTVRAYGGSNVGAVAIDPSNGSVRALVGSYDWHDDKFGKVNMVTTPRQPGSTFKPIYYAEALAKGTITPATIIKDEPIDISGYQPKNDLGNYNGDVTVRQALAWSLNIPAVKVMQKLGVSNAEDAAVRMGISTIDKKKDYGLPLALGAAEAKLLDMTNAYAAFGNGGKQMSVNYVTEIKSKYNEVLQKETPTSKQVISAQGAYLISNILSDNAARAGMFGSMLTVSGKKVAVKTGTTDDFRDAWTIGYTPQLALGVWVGNNDNSPMTAIGGEVAGPIWRATMSQVLPAQTGDPFTRPDGIVERNVCYGTGQLASSAGPNTYTDVFMSSALPSYGCAAQPQTTTPQVDKPKQQDDTSTPPKKDTTDTSGTGGGTGGTTGTGDTDTGDSGTGSSGTGTGGSTGSGSTNPGGSAGSGTGGGSNGGTGTGTGGTPTAPQTP